MEEEGGHLRDFIFFPMSGGEGVRNFQIFVRLGGKGDIGLIQLKEEDGRGFPRAGRVTPKDFLRAQRKGNPKKCRPPDGAASFTIN